MEFHDPNTCRTRSLSLNENGIFGFAQQKVFDHLAYKSLRKLQISEYFFFCGKGSRKVKDFK